MRITHTYALLEVSPAVYDEVARLLRAAGYAEAINSGEIDMHGLALTRSEATIVTAEEPPAPGSDTFDPFLCDARGTSHPR